MKRIYILLLTSCLTATIATGQAIKLSETPEQFLTDIQKLMATGGAYSVKAEKDLQALWAENRLSQQQKDRIIALSRKMNAKRYQPQTHFAPFYESLYHASFTQKNLTPPDIDNLILVAEKQFEANDPKAFAKVMETLRLFLDRRLFYASNYNKLYAEGGTFSFQFVDGSQPANGASVGDPTSETSSSATRVLDDDGWGPIPAQKDSTQPRQLGRVFIPQKRPMPPISGAVLSVKNVFLSIVANGDSALISDTGGELLLKDGIFVGKGGKLTWDVAGRSDIFVTLTDYAMSTMNPRLSADDVTLTYEKNKPIKGVVEYVSKKRVAGQAAQYPRFVSWQNDVTLPELGKDIDYRGGLALSGLQLVGASASGQPAELTIKYNGKPGFKVSSRRFEFSDSLITSNAVQFTGYIEPADSVTHPAVQFKYDKTQQVAWLNRVDKTGYGQVPFADTYHKFFIQPEVARWDLPRRKVDFYQIGAKRDVPVRFESFDYFHPQRYSDISVDYGFHPLQLAASYISTKKTQTFLPDELAQFGKVNARALEGSLDRMVVEGYILRDPASGYMRLSRKGILYVLAYNNKSDYDNFQVQSYFTSSDSVKNATINLNDKYLTIRGVNVFTISDSLKIFGIPSDKTLKIGKGRAFTLNGQLKAGTFRYSGRDLSFDYDKFAMNLNKIDSITFTPQKLAAQGKTGEIGGDIKYEKPGMVYFATTDNKSGRIKSKKTTQRLVMPEGMTVYFNQPERGDLAYNNKVYFKIPAIDNDSIGQGEISFIGTFYSDGIMPPFKAELKTMPDNTLGFVHKAPATGYPLYGGKSTVKFTGDLKMDKSGLRAEGIINHLTATLTANGLLFKTDSLLASGDKGEIKEGLVGKAYFPQVQLNNYSLKWWPKADSMVIMTQKNNFNFYNGSTKLDGNLVLRTGGLFGKGTLLRNDSETMSGNIKFNKEGFLANNAQFRVVSDAAQRNIANKPILLGSGVDVDFNQLKGIVNVAIRPKVNQSIDDTLVSSMEFPYAAYKTSISRAQWNMNAKTIAMKAGPTVGDVKTSTFTATGEDQEGLTFNAAAALYEIEKMTLNISGVPYINSADARIFPDKGLVAIRRNGEMMALKNARIELDTISLHHKMKNGNIQIASRTRFSGDATYQFATAAGDTANIKMGSFELKEATVAPQALASSAPLSAAEKAMVGDVKEEKDTKRRKNADSKPTQTYFTVARAEIDEKDNLMLAPRIAFKGDIVMQAPDKDLALDGFIKPALKKRSDLISGWIPFKEKVVKTIEVKVDKNLKNEGDQQLVAGIHARIDGTGLYPTFLSPKEDPKDDDLFTATGVMRYDEKEKVFRIIQKDANGLEDVEGAFTFDDPKGIMTFKGPLNLFNAQPNNFLLSAGSVRVNVDSVKYQLNTLLAFTLPVPEPVNLAIADKLVKTNLDEKNDEPADEDLSELADKLIPLIGEKETEAYRLKAQNQHIPLVQASPKLNAAIVLSNVNLRWSEKFKAFYSIGQLGVSHMNNTDINAQMDGFVEIRKAANGDEVSIYIESSPDVWVFYDYKPGQLAIVASEQEINDRLLAGSKNSAKGAIEVIAGTADEKNQFVSLYLDQYKTRPKPQPKAPGSKVVKKAPVKKKDKEETKEGF